MRKKISLFILALCVLIQIGVISYRAYQNAPKDFTKIDIQEYADSFHYYYNHLSQNGKIAYTVILKQIQSFPKEIEIPYITQEEYDAVFLALSYDNPKLFFLENSSEMHTRGEHYYFLPKYRLSKEDYQVQLKELVQKAEQICNSMPQNASDFQKELFFHDFICLHTLYNASPPVGYTAYDALVIGDTVCEGYARAMQLLLNQVNIPNYLVTGMIEDFDELGHKTTEGHMWNIVELEGNPYHLDVTWDDVGEHRTDYFQHNYFNVTDQEIAATHKKISPENNNCHFLECNYFVKTQSRFSDYNSFTEESIRNLMKDAVSNGDFEFEIQFSTSVAYQKGKKELVKDGKIFQILKSVDSQLYKQCKDISYIQSEELGTIQFIMKKEK